MERSDQYLFKYVEPMAFLIAPDYDEDGNYCSSMYLSNFLNNHDQIKSPLSYEKFLKQTDITNTLAGFGFEIEPFWLVVKFTYYVMEKKCVNVTMMGDSARNQLMSIVDYHKYNNGVEISVSSKGKKKVAIENTGVVDLIVKTIDNYLRTTETDLSWQQFDLKQGKQSYPPSIQMWYVANAFISFFNEIQLKKKRYGRNDLTSYNQKLLISRIVYYMGLTRNESFLDHENALNGILKKYNNFKLNSFA